MNSVVASPLDSPLSVLSRRFSTLGPLLLSCACAAVLLGCGESGGDAHSGAAPAKLAAEVPAPAPSTPKTKNPTTPDEMSMGLVLGLSVFPEPKPGETGPPVPLPAELEFLVRRGGEWVKTSLSDPDSNVFHKAMAYGMPNGQMGLLTGGGERALLKLWTKVDGQYQAQALWEKDFGGKFSRMRDLEVGDIDGNGTNVIAVATHDQGVVAVVRPKGEGYEVQELDFETAEAGDGVEALRRTPSCMKSNWAT